MDVFELKEWFSVTDAAARLTGIVGRPVSTDDVLNYLIEGRLQASILSPEVFATPLVSMTQEESKSFVGTSWTTPVGVRIGATWETVVLAAIKPVLDLSVCRSGCGEFVDDVRRRRLDTDREIRIPPGTLIQIPNTEEYFAVLGGTDVPTTYGQIVVRTDALCTLQKEYLEEKEKRIQQAKLDTNDGNAPAIETVTDATPVGAQPEAEPVIKGVTTAQIDEAFGCLPGININLKKAMTDKTIWTNDARITSGTKGGKHKSLWDPVILATALRERYKAPMIKLNQAFNTHTFLSDWREEWNRLSTM